MCLRASSCPQGQGSWFTLGALAAEEAFHEAALTMGSLLAQPVSALVPVVSSVLASCGAALVELELLRAERREEVLVVCG